MGLTGSGKSLFIKTVTGAEVVIGTKLKSCTDAVKCYSFFHNDLLVHLTDTPGFNDTFRSDTQVPEGITTWLVQAYKQTKKLAGIIYLHNIQENRMGHSAMLNVSMFQQLCGDDCLGSVVLATSFWDKWDQKDPEFIDRENELIHSHEYWGPLVERGVRTARYNNSRASALRVVDMLASTSTIDLDIQRQMVDEHRTLGETAAGKSLQVELNRERRRHEQERKQWNKLLEKSLREKDNMQAALAKQFMEERDKQIKRTEEDMIRLKQTFETLQQEAFREHEARREAERAEMQARITIEREAAEQQRREHGQARASERAAREQDVHAREEIATKLEDAQRKLKSRNTFAVLAVFFTLVLVLVFRGGKESAGVTFINNVRAIEYVQPTPPPVPSFWSFGNIAPLVVAGGVGIVAAPVIVPAVSAAMTAAGLPAAWTSFAGMFTTKAIVKSVVVPLVGVVGNLTMNAFKG